MYDLSKFEVAAKRSREKLSEELGGLRTGRANPVLVKDIAVDYFGSKMKLEGLASISVQDARTLLIQPWDKNSIEPIEKAVRASNLGLQPVADKNVLRIILPELTGERRAALLKLTGEKLEASRVALRQEREAVWKDIQEKERKGEMSEDEKFRLKDDLQKKIDRFNKDFEELAEKKKQEISS
ncbi:MAG: ribosome recycling factor [Candidatus Niyogibacteria bacterium]|nr:ribosome recycling factor [Candidatus Niyogibacteria bacterium]